MLSIIHSTSWSDGERLGAWTSSPTVYAPGWLEKSSATNLKRKAKELRHTKWLTSRMSTSGPQENTVFLILTTKLKICSEGSAKTVANNQPERPCSDKLVGRRGGTGKKRPVLYSTPKDFTSLYSFRLGHHYSHFPHWRGYAAIAISLPNNETLFCHHTKTVLEF